MTHSELVQKVCAMAGEPIPNQSPETGIHYGVISQHDVMPEAIDDIFTNGTDLGWESASAELESEIKAIASEAYNAETEDEKLAILRASDWLEDDALELAELIADAETEDDAMESVWNEVSESALMQLGDSGMESGPYRWDDSEYSIQYDSDGDIWVFNSPFYTLCRECSPCAPNAGYLTSQPGSMKTYCLGVDWFEDETAPYPVYRVSDDVLIFQPASEE